MVRLLISIAALGLVSTPVFAGPCRDKGNFVKCPTATFAAVIAPSDANQSPNALCPSASSYSLSSIGAICVTIQPVVKGRSVVCSRTPATPEELVIGRSTARTQSRAPFRDRPLRDTVAGHASIAVFNPAGCEPA